MVAMEQTSKPIQSLHRAFEILELLSECPSGMALTVLAQQTGLSKSTTHRFLSSLREMGYVAQDANTGKYRQTLRMFEIGSRSVRALSILEIAQRVGYDSPSRFAAMFKREKGITPRECRRVRTDQLPEEKTIA